MRASSSPRSPGRTASAAAAARPTNVPATSSGSCFFAIAKSNTVITIASTSPARRPAASSSASRYEVRLVFGTPASITACSQVVPGMVPTRSPRSSSIVRAPGPGRRVIAMCRTGNTSLENATFWRRAGVSTMPVIRSPSPRSSIGMICSKSCTLTTSSAIPSRRQKPSTSSRSKPGLPVLSNENISGISSEETSTRRRDGSPGSAARAAETGTASASAAITHCLSVRSKLASSPRISKARARMRRRAQRSK